MGMVAGLLIQNTLKYNNHLTLPPTNTAPLTPPPQHNRYLLSFGEVSYFLGYTAMRDYFPRYTMKPNPTCSNPDCRTSQQEYASKPKKEEKKEVEEKKVVHASNEWGITLGDDDDLEDQGSTSTPGGHAATSGHADQLPDGIKLAYNAPNSSAHVKEEDKVRVDPSAGLGDLAAMLAGLQTKNK